MQITLDIEKNGNVTAVFTGTGSEQIKRLFNSNRVPTPYTFSGVEQIEQHGAYIIRQIRSRNLGVTVEWSPERCQQIVAFKHQ